MLFTKVLGLFKGKVELGILNFHSMCFFDLNKYSFAQESFKDVNDDPGLLRRIKNSDETKAQPSRRYMMQNKTESFFEELVVESCQD